MLEKISAILAPTAVAGIFAALFAGAYRLVRQEGGMNVAIVVVTLVILAAITSVAIATRQSKDDASMPMGQRWLLLAYLLSIGACLVYLISALGSVDFPETPALTTVESPPRSTAGSPEQSKPGSPEQSKSGSAAQPTAGSAAQPTAGSAAQPTAGPGAQSKAGSPAQSKAVSIIPVLKYAFSQSTAGSSSDLSLTVYGEAFEDSSYIRINSKEHATKTLEKGSLLSTPLLPSDVTGVSSLTVEVVNPPDKRSNALMLDVSRPRVRLKVFGYPFRVTRELQLLLLIIFAGALGSYVHAIRSLTVFIGNRSVVASWFWWYIARPFVGMSMALIFYAVLRGGFLAGTPADAKFVNPFGVVGIGALVGMFADKAAQKLSEVFDILFKADDTRKDKLVSPTIDKVTPDHVKPAPATLPEIRISGTHLSGIEKVRVNQQDRVPKSIDDKQVTIVLMTSDVAQPGEITLALVDKAGMVTSAGTIAVTDLEISAPAGSPSAEALPPATTGQKYSQTVTATGGTAPYQWTLDSGSGFVIASTTGEISGTPKSAGDFVLKIKLQDSKKASVSRAFTLKVN